MRVLRAQHLGMCFGVRDAIALAFTHGESAPLTILGDLVHNEAVLASLQAKGIAVARNPIDRVRHLVALMRQRFPQSDVRFIDTVCHPTKQRQSAAIDLARQIDVVIVVGGENSNNTRTAWLENSRWKHSHSLRRAVI